MSPTGHNLTAAALGVAAAVPLYRAGLPLEGALAMAGAMFGARAPDWMELFKYAGDKRLSLIPHRTLTHWPPLWVAIAILLYVYVPAPGHIAAATFLAAAVMHLLFDIMTPAGIPLLHPFGKRYSLGIYRSRNFLAEAVLVLLTWASAAAFLLLYHSSL